MRGSSARKCETPICAIPHIEAPEPLFELVDVEWMVERIKRLPYQEPNEIAPGVTLTYLDAGHILGSAIIQIDFRENGLPAGSSSPATSAAATRIFCPTPPPFRTSTSWSPRALTAIAISIPTTA